MMIRYARLPVPIAVVSRFGGLSITVVASLHSAATLQLHYYSVMNTRSMQLPLNSFGGYRVLDIGVRLGGYLRQCSLTI